MAKLPASLFNDVIGPVMRGPSSSHVAGAARIGALVRQSLGGDVRSVLVEFDVNGSLAESYHGHGSDIGFVSGLLDIDLTDPRVPDACAIAEREGVEVAFSILDYGASHPNNYRIAATGGDGRTLHWEAVSVGGGMVAPLLPPVGVWAVSQSQCGRSPSQAGYGSSPWWAVTPPTS